MHPTLKPILFPICHTAPLTMSRVASSSPVPTPFSDLFWVRSTMNLPNHIPSIRQDAFTVTLQLQVVVNLAQTGLNIQGCLFGSRTQSRGRKASSLFCLGLQPRFSAILFGYVWLYELVLQDGYKQSFYCLHLGKRKWHFREPPNGSMKVHSNDLPSHLNQFQWPETMIHYGCLSPSCPEHFLNKAFKKNGKSTQPG